MALRITLRPLERIIINGALIRNGNRAGELLIETQCKFLRESEIIREEEVDTPCKQLWMTMQVLHLAEDPAEPQILLFKQATELLKTMPSAAPFIAAMSKALDENYTYKALKEVRQLVFHERDLTEEKRNKSQVA